MSQKSARTSWRFFVGMIGVSRFVGAEFLNLSRVNDH
jgi:hypothetical protein